MSTRRSGDAVLWVLAAALLVAGAAAAGVSALLGERRRIETSMAIPVGLLLAGLLLSATVALGALVLQRRRRHRLSAERSRSAAYATGAQAERDNHRRFLARLDHELKNPITAIRAVAASGQEALAAPDAWESVDAQARKLSTLVRDLRKLAELETRPLERERVDLEQLLHEAVGAIGQQHPDAAPRLTITVTRVPWPVPPVHADLDLLAVAVDNVLANAVKFSSGGAIEVRLREEDGQAVIEVADSGRGIPADELPQVFDELARAQNARDVPGSGIGLSLVSTILRRHGGDASVRSAEGSGTVLTLRLPLGA